MTGSPWWYDYGTHEIVRSSDGRRWSADDVPELRRSLEEWATNPVVDVAEVDRWVLVQFGNENPAAGDTATGRGAGAGCEPGVGAQSKPGSRGCKP